MISLDEFIRTLDNGAKVYFYFKGEDRFRSDHDLENETWLIHYPEHEYLITNIDSDYSPIRGCFISIELMYMGGDNNATY